MTRAIIFLPEGLPLDGAFTRQCIAHCERRGYDLHDISRDWAGVLEVLCAGRVTVVVLARQEHFDPTWEPRIEYVGNDTRNMAMAETRHWRRNRPQIIG